MCACVTPLPTLSMILPVQVVETMAQMANLGLARLAEALMGVPTSGRCANNDHICKVRIGEALMHIGTYYERVLVLLERPGVNPRAQPARLEWPNPDVNDQYLRLKHEGYDEDELNARGIPVRS